MKNIVATFAFIFVSCFSAFANPADNRSLEQTRKLASYVHFNENIFIQVKKLNDARFKELDLAAQENKNNPVVLQARLQEIDTKYNNQIGSLLTSNQLAEYKTYLSVISATMVAIQ